MQQLREKLCEIGIPTRAGTMLQRNDSSSSACFVPVSLTCLVLEGSKPLHFEETVRIIFTFYGIDRYIFCLLLGNSAIINNEFCWEKIGGTLAAEGRALGSSASGASASGDTRANQLAARQSEGGRYHGGRKHGEGDRRQG